MLSVKQEGIKYHFLSLWYDLTWEWTQVSWAFGEHSNHYANVLFILNTSHLHYYVTFLSFLVSMHYGTLRWLYQYKAYSNLLVL